MLMKEKIILFIGAFLALSISACVDKPEKIGGKATFAFNLKDTADVSEIHSLLDSLNIAAAQANFDKYFSYFAEGATYNGTDATENWDKESFKVWAKPYFDAKTTWNFKSVKRSVYHIGTNYNIAWFDELLATQMKICRGSGVVIKEKGEWKIQQYVLSMTIPNSKLDDIIKIKAAEEDSLLADIERN